MAEGDLGTSGSSGLSTSQMGTLGAGALALGGMGYMLSKGPSPLPWQYGAATAQAPELYARSATDWSSGQALVSDAAKAYDMARRGELTPAQQAANKMATTAETNTAKQMFANMGRNFDMDTSAISVQENIDLNANARAQQFIQSTIALAGSEMQGGSALIGQSLGESNAATNILLEAGKAQVAQNKAYSDSMASAFKAVGTVFGTAIGAYFGGPVGASIGGSLGGSLGSEIGGTSESSAKSAVYG